MIDKEFFLFLLRNNPSAELLSHLDRVFCKCGYIRHWCIEMTMGRWNPMQNEMDAELKDIHTLEQLYEFLIARNHEVQEHTKQP